MSLRAKQDTPGGGRVSVLLKHETGASQRFEAMRTLPSFEGNWWWGPRNTSWKFKPMDSVRTVTKAWIQAEPRMV